MEYLKEEGEQGTCHIRDSFFSMCQEIDILHRWEVWLEGAVCLVSMMEGLRKSTLAAGRVDRFKGFGSFKMSQLIPAQLLLMVENLRMRRRASYPRPSLNEG